MKVIKNTTFIDLLNRYVTTYVLLPKNYHEKTMAYPVIYMHDGQNLFSHADKFSKEIWNLKKVMNTQKLKEDVIIIGISSAKNSDRLNEFLPFSLEIRAYNQYGGHADKYLEYIANILKPHMDQTYRTNALRTYMMGASLGGVISLYAGIKYPNIFKGVASLSGAFFAVPVKLKSFIEKNITHRPTYIYMDCGDNETFNATKETYLKTNQDIYETIQKNLKVGMVEYFIIPDGKHQESDWQKRFSDVVNRLLSYT